MRSLHCDKTICTCETILTIYWESTDDTDGHRGSRWRPGTTVKFSNFELTKTRWGDIENEIGYRTHWKDIQWRKSYGENSLNEKRELKEHNQTIYNHWRGIKNKANMRRSETSRLPYRTINIEERSCMRCECRLQTRQMRQTSNMFLDLITVRDFLNGLWVKIQERKPEWMRPHHD